MRVVFMIIDYVPHQEQTIKNLIETVDCEVLAFHAALHEKNVPQIKNFSSLYYKDFKQAEILEKILQFNPDFVVTAGWMIPEFIKTCKQLKKKVNIPIVAQSDTPWYGKFTQRVNCMISPFHLRKAFTHLWVAGYYQYEYAKRLGFQNHQILLNSLSANVTLFNKVDIDQKRGVYPKNFIFIGRFSNEKGIMALLEAWSSITDKKDWKLTLVGKGPLREKMDNVDNVVIKDYMSQEDLFLELQNSGCFILPSSFEPWALVIHEAASAGLPIICTEVCGAAPHFVLSNYNGYKIKTGSKEAIKAAMEKIINLDTATLCLFSERSRTLGNTIDSKTAIGNLLQCLS